MEKIKLKDLKQYAKVKTIAIEPDKYVYVKDSEGYVKKILRRNLTDKYSIITKQEWADLSGESYYKETFTHGGAREGSGRKKLNRDINIRVTIGEKNLLDYIRQNSIDPSKVKEQLT